MPLEADYLGAFEEHSPDGIRDALAAGASPIELIKGKSPIDCLIEGYLRSPRFAACLQVVMDAGATINDPVVKALLLDDEAGLRRLLDASGQDVLSRKLRVPCAFTSCAGAMPLHICAEFYSVRCARVLLDAGADVNGKADIDADGFGGQTPVFHAVNSIFNYCRPMLEILVEASADLDVRLNGLLWGVGADWETLVLDVTPISYAQCGLYAQFHRREHDVYSNLTYLHRRRHGTELRVRNVPNRYLAPTA
ncbi:MAG: ankyrin repeat domain-containing protein [Acidobacteria bacterium]|nr:ankyrin repeat domain-containing protein [Acidobacteriota bacterium]